VSRSRILVVDDEPDMVDNCARILERAGFVPLTTTDPRRGLTMLETERPDLVLTDLKMPEVDGMALLHRARELDPALPVIVITAFATIESAIAAIREGAFDYLPKPFSVDQLRVAVDRALQHRGLQRENRSLKEQLAQIYGLENIVGRSTAMTRVFELVRKAARSEANILILGESGTGKELIARAIHVNSPRAAKPFMPVDCASMPEQLLESELFGHEKGAFTGAVRSKPGLLEVAQGARCSSTRSRSCPWRSRASCCAHSRNGKSVEWEAQASSTSMSGSCPPPIAIFARQPPAASSVRSSIIVST